MEECELGTVSEASLDKGIAALTKQLRNVHPLIPLLLQEVRVDDPEQQLPLVFKWGEPSIKSLNDVHFGMARTDQFFGEVQALIAQHFGPTVEGLPILSLLNFDFKGGKALLNLNSPALVGGDSNKTAFENCVAVFQSKLNLLLAYYWDKAGLDEQNMPPAYMLFEATDWSMAENPRELTDWDYAEALLLAENVVNMTKRRVSGGSERGGLYKRAECVWRTPEKYAEYLKKDLTLAFGKFGILADEKADDPAWRTILTEIFIQGLPFLKTAALQALRDGTFLAKFPFVSPNEYALLRNFYEVVNTIDVLKPFQAEHKAVFHARIHGIADVLKEKPQDLEAKKSYFTKLILEATSSIKNKETGTTTPELLGTRLGLAMRVYKVMSQSTTPESSSVLLLADFVGFCGINLGVLFADALKYLGTEGTHLEDLRNMLLSAGDAATAYLRSSDSVIRDVYSTETPPYINGSGGDELGAVIETDEDGAAFDIRNKRLIDTIPLRATTTRIPCGLKEPKLAADLLAAIFLVSEEVFKVLKKKGPPAAVTLSIRRD